MKQDRIDLGEIKGLSRAESRELRKAKSRIRELENRVKILRRAIARGMTPIFPFSLAGSPDRQLGWREVEHHDCPSKQDH